MSQAIDLVRTILCDVEMSDMQIRTIIDEALAMEVDVFDYLAHHFGLGEISVRKRAAEWAGLAFFFSVPADIPELDPLKRLDALGDIRHIRSVLDGHSTMFCAPLFSQMISLKAFVENHPQSRERVCVVPMPAIAEALAEAGAEQLQDAARQRLARLWPFASAHLDLSHTARLIFIVLILFATVSTLLPMPWGIGFLPFALMLLLAPAILRLWATFLPTPGNKAKFTLLCDTDLPVYSVLIPLRDEAGMVSMLVRAMQALDYPREKLDIKFVVEAASEQTVMAVRSRLVDGPFELIRVPDRKPRTKPKALNYALPFVRGEHVVIYDAEDIPDPGQLRLAASQFAAMPEVHCLQAALVIDNVDENWLTGFFAAEYAGLFTVLLPAFAHWGLPMPLGGTSNHFRIDALRAVGGWDAFNVTEDIDLGVRLARLRHRCATIDSQTREEAPTTLNTWMRQRTRWMKGWMQTLIVHNRQPRRLFRELGWYNFMIFQINTAGTILSPLLHTLFVITALARLLVPDWGWTMRLDVWSGLQWSLLLIGYGAALAMAARGIVRQKMTGLLPILIFLPFYWVLHTFATICALRELFVRPYFWAKTEHGQTRMDRSPSRSRNSIINPAYIVNK